MIIFSLTENGQNTLLPLPAAVDHLLQEKYMIFNVFRQIPKSDTKILKKRILSNQIPHLHPPGPPSIGRSGFPANPLDWISDNCVFW